MSVQAPVWHVRPVPHATSSRHSTQEPATHTPLCPSVLQALSPSQSGYLGPSQPAPANAANASTLAIAASARRPSPCSPLERWLRIAARVKTHSGELS